jgi:hypothetical protein
MNITILKEAFLFMNIGTRLQAFFYEHYSTDRGGFL